MVIPYCVPLIIEYGAYTTLAGLQLYKLFYCKM